MARPRFHIVLLNPEIPQNTGNIGRTAAATDCALHIVHPIAFDMSEKALRRAGLDYWHMVQCHEHESWEAFLDAENPERLWLFTTKSQRPHWSAKFAEGDYLLFGRETTGVSPEVHAWVAQTYGEHHRITLPMKPAARSLNLSTVVCAAVYEGLRQLDADPM
jgi:tRNA (cytidine/uridine-2'-O-)-methyltransferase